MDLHTITTTLHNTPTLYIFLSANSQRCLWGEYEERIGQVDEQLYPSTLYAGNAYIKQLGKSHCGNSYKLLIEQRVHKLHVLMNWRMIKNWERLK